MSPTTDAPGKRLPRRDLLLLPLLSLLTIAVLLGTSELAAHHFFAASAEDACEVPNSAIGFSYRPGCVSRVKAPEGPWIVNRYNECGYPTAESCGPKTPGSTRIALIGSSVARGLYVEYDRTFAERVARTLTQRCDRPVEVQNLGRELCSVACTFHRAHEALALQPDLLILAISPYDIETTETVDVQHRREPIPARRRGELSSVETAQRRALTKRVQRFLTQSRGMVAAEHLLFQEPGTYLRLWLGYKDKADFLRPPFSPRWEERLRNVDLLVGEIAEQARQAKVPMVLVEIPNVAQVDLVASRTPPPPGIDPFALDERLEKISAGHGVTFVNVLDSFRNAPDPNGLFYVVDGHLNREGSAFISAPLADRLVRGPHPLLSGCTRTEQARLGDRP